jgi:serine O-acetyltransferase
MIQYFRTPGFKVTLWFRLRHYLKRTKAFQKNLYYLAALIGGHYSVKYGIVINADAEIGSGLYIGYFGAIVITGARIGRNVNLSTGVNIGMANRGKRKGVPVIGDNVYIGPGAKIVGKVCVGNNVAIGANCVVASDIPNNAVVVGIPSRVISYNGSVGYINKVSYGEPPDEE